jgi:hypothetical protein
MAGTGHGYEISNIAAVRDVQYVCASHFEGIEGFEGERGWFFSKGFVRFLTSERFVFRLRRENSRMFLDEASPDERALLADKVAAGADVRRFSPDQFKSHGPDVQHAADYARYLERTDARLLRKAGRMPPADFFARVRRWVPARVVVTDLPEGAVTTLLTTTAGRRWLELRDGTALRREGARMSHCVGLGGYTTAEQGGRSRIFSLRDELDRPLVTVEGTVGSVMLIRQIKAFANDPISPGARDCVCELLDYLGVVAHSEYLAYAHITLVKGRGWAPIEKVWKRVEIAGLDAMAENGTAILASPSRPDVSLLRVTGTANWWESGVRDGLSVSMADQRNWHIDEIRAVCRFVDAFGTNNPLSYCVRDQSIVEKDGHHVPFVDAIERRMTGDAEYFLLPDGAAVVYQSSSRTVPLVEIGPMKGGARSTIEHLYAMPCSVERWNATDTRRCLEVMTHLNAMELRPSLLVFDDPNAPFSADRDREINALRKKFEIRRSGDGRWYSFTLEAKLETARTIDAEWLVGDDLLRLTRAGSGEGRNYDIELSPEGVRSIGAWIYADEILKEIADFLNRRKIACTSTSYSRNPLPKKRGKLGWVYHLAGKWRVVRSQKDLATIFRTRQPAKADRSVFALLPIEESERLRSCDDILRRSAPFWLDVRVEKDFVARYPSAGRTFSSEAKTDWDWQAIHWIIDNREILPVALRKKFVRTMGGKLVELAQWSLSIGGARDQEEAGLLLRKMGDEIPKGLLEKAVRTAFRRNGYFRFKDENDLAWLDLAPRLSNTKANVTAVGRMLDQARSALYGLSNVNTEEKARVLAACALFCGERRDILFDGRMDDVRVRADELAAEGLEAVATILRDGAALAEKARNIRIEARRREQEEWMAKFFPQRAAA